MLFSGLKQISMRMGKKREGHWQDNLKKIDNQNVITAIKKDDTLVTSSSDINMAFKMFYQDLYTSENMVSKDQMDAFFDKMTIPKISQNDKDKLETPLTEVEVNKAIGAMKSGKLPGIDGFPAEFYQKCIDILCPFLTEVFHEAFEYGSIPESFNQAVISLIPKGDKDLTDPANYKPISLINVDCKILSKVLATRLDFVLPQIIHKDQVGFIKNRSASDNMRRLLHLLWMNRNNVNPVLAISLDA